MEIIIQTPGFYMHLHDAVLFVQFCIDGIIHIASQIKIQLVDFLIIIVLGAIWGSFANVCIYRLPKNKEIIIQSSFCPNCKKKIQWFDNITILSFIFLSGRCRKCKKSISPRYLVVEFLGIISFLLIYLNFRFQTLSSFFQ